MNREEAKEKGYTHNATLFEVPIYYNINTSDVHAKTFLLGLWLDFLIWCDGFMGATDAEWPILILNEL